MSFFTDNQEFIIGKLYPIARYSGWDKEMHYGKVRNELYDRILAYYVSVDRMKFYNEVIHFVGEWELENLVFNLFLEKDLELLVNGVSIKKNLNYNFKSSLLQSLFEKYLVKNENFKWLYFSLDLLRKSEMMEISREDWDSVESGKHPIVSKFSAFVNNSLLNSNKVDLHEGYLVMVYAWSLYHVMHSPFNNTKAILLCNSLNKFIDENVNNNDFRKNFVEFIFSIDKIEKYCFAENENIFFPFTNNLKDDKYKEGLRSQSKKLCLSFDSFATQLDCKNWNFFELAEEICKAPEDVVKVVKDEFVNRININNYPPVEVLNNISDLDILRKAYRFERLVY